MHFVSKTRLDNDMTDLISLLYFKTENELLGPIWTGAVYDENQTGQWPDQSYKYGLCRKQNCVVVINQSRCSLWWKQYNTKMCPIVYKCGLRRNWN